MYAHLVQRPQCANPPRQPELEDTANAYVMLAQNRSMTGQALQVGKCSDTVPIAKLIRGRFRVLHQVLSKRVRCRMEPY